MNEGKQAVIARQANQVVECLRIGETRGDFLERFGKEWGCSRATVDDRISRAGKIYGVELLADRATSLGKQFAKVQKLYGLAMAKKDVRVALECVREQNKMLGVHAAIEVEHRVPDAWRETFLEGGIKIPGNGKGDACQDDKTLTAAH